MNISYHLNMVPPKYSGHPEVNFPEDQAYEEMAWPSGLAVQVGFVSRVWKWTCAINQWVLKTMMLAEIQ